MLITRKSRISDIERTIDLPVTEEQMFNYNNGMLAQRAFPHLSASDKEFIITGITAEEWEATFPPEEPDEDRH